MFDFFFLKIQYIIVNVFFMYEMWECDRGVQNNLFEKQSFCLWVQIIFYFDLS